MWKDYRKSILIRNIILAVVSLALVVGLAAAILIVRKRTQEQDAVLIEAYTQQQQEQSAARQQAVTAIQAEYEKDMQTVAEYLPGIVCWGDKLTGGSSGNVAFPEVLQTYIDAYICDVYNFRLSIKNAEDYSRLDWDAYTVDIPVVNMGAGEEDTSTVLGRCGAVPYVVKSDFVIPAGTESVEIQLASQNGRDVAPLTGGSVGVNNVMLAGIEGTVTLEPGSLYSYGYNKYFFSRLTPGQETPVAAGTEVTTAAADMYKDYLHIICIGTYGGYDVTPSVLVEQTRQLIARQELNPDRYIILGICSVDDSWGSGWNYTLDAIDSAMVQAFGNHYINVRKYLCTDGLTDAKITATKDDTYALDNGVVPTSLRSSAGDAELNGKAYKLIGKLIYNRMQTLGYFDEVNKELYIEEARKELLKDDPDYFTKMLAESLK